MQRTARFAPWLVLAVPLAGLLFQPEAATQQPKQPIVNFQERELKAPAAIKTRLANFREEIKARKLTFEVGYTTALDRNPQSLLGARAPANLLQLAKAQNSLAAQMLKVDTEARTEFVKKNPTAQMPGEAVRLKIKLAATHFDWRDYNKVTPVRDQGNCGSCWDFASIGAFEGSYLIRNFVAADAYKTLNLSEQHVLTCSKAGTCGGGWHAGVFDWFIKHGVCADATLPYKAKDGACDAKIAGPYRAVAWGYVKADARGIPTIADMKAALKEHGPLAVAFEVTGPFYGYTKGVFKDYTTPNDASKIKINHDVTLIGWDDAKHAWIIKNSWGTGWGINGYCYIDYNTNCIGYGAAWVQAKSNFYVLPPKYFQTFKDILPHPGPLKPIKINPAENIKGVSGAGGEQEIAVTNDPTASPSPSPGAPRQTLLTEADNGARVSVAREGQLLLKLPAQPGTGFSWQVVKYDPKVIEPSGETSFEDAKDNQAGGTQLQVLRFRVRAAGSCALELAYRRVFDKNTEPARTFSAVVCADEAAR